MSYGTCNYGAPAFATLCGVGDLTVFEGASFIPDGENLPRNFGLHEEGSAEPTKTFTVTNVGSEPITISTITVPAGYEIVTPLPSLVLAPGESGDFVVKLKTDTIGTFTGDIEINSDDPDEDPYNWAVKGTIAEEGSLACSPLPRHGFLVPRRRSLHRLCNLNREYFDHRWVGIEKRPLEQQAEPAGGD